MDIENNVGAYNYIFLIEKLRALFATDESKKYYISGAPQCVVPDASMGDMIFNTVFDYLFLQFYNTPTCSARGLISGYGPTGGENQYFTYDAWREFTDVSFSKSKGSKLFIGLSASVDAADRDDEDRPYYCKSPYLGEGDANRRKWNLKRHCS
jgi:chitinase